MAHEPVRSSARALQHSKREKNLSVEVLDGIADFQALQDEWQELFENAVTPLAYFSHSWLHLSWSKALRRTDNKVVAILVREDGRLVMAGVFLLTLKNERRIVRFLTSRTPQLEDILWRETTATSRHADLVFATLRDVAHDHRQLWTRRLPEDSVLRAAMIRAGVKMHRQHVIDRPVIRLSDHQDFNAYVSSLSSNQRQDSRRQLRRLSRLNGFEHSHETSSRFGDALSWLIGRKREWLADENLSNRSFLNRNVEKFFNDLAAAEGTNVCWLSTFRIEGTIIAAALSFKERDSISFRIVAHDPAYSTYAPGRCLVLKLIEKAYAMGLDRICLGFGDVDWKLRLGAEPQRVLSERIDL